MTRPRLHVLIAASEAVPFIKRRGLADITGALAKALTLQGHRVSLVLPGYRSIKTFAFTLHGAAWPLTVGHRTATVQQLGAPNTPVTAYVIQDDFFDRDEPYGEGGRQYPDNPERFAFFSRAVVELARSLDPVPEVIHCHDWQTALIPVLLRRVHGQDEKLQSVATLLTIHNIAAQGLVKADRLEAMELPLELYRLDALEFWERASFLKGGLLYADILTTVSPTYAKEIRESDEYGMGLKGVLQQRADDLVGVLNGVDYDVWDPAIDAHLPFKFDAARMGPKKQVKEALLKELKLTPDEKDSPMLCLIGGLTEMKGIDLVVEALPGLLRRKLHVAILGTDEEDYGENLLDLQKRFPQRLSVTVRFDEPLAHRLYGAADVMLLPYRFLPGSQAPMVAMKYGALPVARRTGGLADIVTDINRSPDAGNGFVFHEYTPGALADACMRALKLYASRPKWEAVVARAMASDFSWDMASRAYAELYRQAIARAAGSRR